MKKIILFLLMVSMVFGACQSDNKKNRKLPKPPKKDQNQMNPFQKRKAAYFEKLNLTPDVQVKYDSIFGSYDYQRKSFRHAHRRQYDLIKATHDSLHIEEAKAIEAILTPAQMETYKAYKASLPKLIRGKK